MLTVAAADTARACDCPGDIFSTPRDTVIKITDSCWVKVTWSKRTACGVWSDLQIHSIMKLTSGCNGLNAADLMKKTTEALIIANPMGFPMPSPGNCVTTWRVTHAQCWKLDTNACGDVRVIPCGAGCCINRYRVCMSSTGVVTVTPNGSILTGQCIPTASCEFVCNEGSPVGGGSPMIVPDDGKPAGSGIIKDGKQILKRAPESVRSRDDKK
jgi:hypothetical protein